MLSDAGTEEPWFALSKDKYQTILNRALSEMEETPALPPSTIISNCSELIKLLNQDDQLGSGSTGELNAGRNPRGARSTSIGNKRDLDRTDKSSAVVVAEKIPRRSADIETGRSKHKTNGHGKVKESWKFPSAGCCPYRLEPGKANARIDCARDVAKLKSVAWTTTETLPVHLQGTGVKLETAQYTTESRTPDLSLNQQNWMTASSSQNINSRYPLRIPKAFNLRPHDNGGKYCSASAKKCYTSRSSVTEESILNDLLTVETKSIPNIDLKTPMLVPGNSLERTAWRSSHLVSGKSELVEGVNVKVENTQLTQDNSSTFDTIRVDNTRNIVPVCFPDAEKVRNVTELKIHPESWSNENSASAEFSPLTDVMAGDADVRHHSFHTQHEASAKLRSKFSIGMRGLERHSRRFNDQPRSGLNQNAEGAETPSLWPYRNPGFEASCLSRNESQKNPVRQATEFQRDKDVRSVHTTKALQLGTCFGEEPRPILTGHDEETAPGETGHNAVPSKRVQHLWAVVDKAVVSSMMEKILEKETNDISARNLVETTTKSCVETERALDLFENRPIPSEQSALLSCKTSDEPVEYSTDFPLEWERTHQNLNVRPTFLNGCEQLRQLTNDDVIGEVRVCGYSGSERCQLNRSDDVTTFGADDIRSEDAVRFDISTFEATLLDDLKLRSGISTNDNGRLPSCVKGVPKLDAGNGAKAVPNDVAVDVTRVDMSHMSFKWKSNILRRLRNDQILAKKWCLSGTLLA